MDICRMDKPSHFYPGLASHQMLNPNYDFNEINPSESDASSSLAYDKNLSHDVGYHDHSKLGWKSESVECKQEADPVEFMINSGVNENSESDFNEPFRYGYKPNSPPFNVTNSTSIIASSHKNNVHQPRMGPYQMSSTKNQLPSWYNPPSTYYTQQPNFFQPLYPYHQQGSYAGAQPAPEAPAEHNMRNMIHLTSR